MEEKFIRAGKLIEKAQKVLCISHKRPDGDTLGAACAMYAALKNLGKEVDMACIDEIHRRFLFLPGINKMIRDFDFRDYDLLIVLDAGASYMTKYQEKYPDIWGGDVPVINMDHHASNDNFGTCNVVDANSASTTVIQYKFFNFIGIDITPPHSNIAFNGYL